MTEKAAQKDMSFLDHLEELRGRLVKAVLGVIAGVIVVVIFHDFVVNDVIMGPKNADFITYRALCNWSHMIGMGEDLCLDPPRLNLQSTTMGGNFNADILVCILGGIVLAFPFIFWQIWGFIKPGLNEREIKSVNGVVFYVSLLFFAGIAFGYFILAPLSIQFLGNYTFGDVQNNATILSYLKLTTSLVFGTGLMFQLPVFIYFLSKIGLVTSAFLKKYRKHAFVANLIISAIITPPDVVSQLVVAFPILLLYEASIYVCSRVERSRLKKA
jgi:sec-independent protein translocase protein TatC